jgi:uncharacterized protein YbbK (DUF523 family)
MHFVLVSACLLGAPVRYNGGDKRSDSDVLQRWLRDGRVVSVCPEVAGGLPVPRLAAEIVGGVSGTHVLAGRVKVIDRNAHDVSAHFVAGAEQALLHARQKGIRVAVLKEGSPSCGSSFVYDGTFTGNKVMNAGVTTALLQSAGIQVFSEAQFAEADALLMSLETQAALR